MKKHISKLFIAFGAVALLGSCNDFEDINKDPNAVSAENVKIEYLLNQSMYDAQQDPNIAERVFILTWHSSARFHRYNTYVGSGMDGWMTEYWYSYVSKWIKNVNYAVELGNERVAKGEYVNKNIIQMCRIWRAYLWTEQVDTFGPCPTVNAYKGVNPGFDDVKIVYYEALKELTEAVAGITDSKLNNDESKNDIMFAGDLDMWKRYANSLRMRLAMRLSEVDQPKAKAEFEAAVSAPGGYISAGQIAQVKEAGGWDQTTGVFTRPWNGMAISFTMSNLTMGLGGVTVDDLKTINGNATYGLTDEIITSYAKDPNKYLGKLMPNHLPTTTNIQNAGYLFEGIPYVMDPRTYFNFNIPGHDDGTVMWKKSAQEVDLPKNDETGSPTFKQRVEYTWGALPYGNWDIKGTLFAKYSSTVNLPLLSKKLRDNTNMRVFFGAWESYFLVAEAAFRGWNTGGVTAQQAYEQGVTESLKHYKLPQALIDKYLESESYNRVGTSAKFTHTAEAAPVSLTYVDVADGQEKSVVYKYPKGFYDTNNDILTKIITQKYISQSPWLPLEGWSDYRRLGLPFFENFAREKAIVAMPWYTDHTSVDVQNVIQRMAYPTPLFDNNKEGYDQGVSLLGGKGDVNQNPLWWARKN